MIMRTTKRGFIEDDRNNTSLPAAPRCGRRELSASEYCQLKPSTKWEYCLHQHDQPTIHDRNETRATRGGVYLERSKYTRAPAHYDTVQAHGQASAKIVNVFSNISSDKKQWVSEANGENTWRLSVVSVLFFFLLLFILVILIRCFLYLYFDTAGNTAVRVRIAAINSEMICLVMFTTLYVIVYCLMQRVQIK